MRQRANVQVSRWDEWDASRRPKSSQDVVETSLCSLVPSIDMTSAMETDTRIRHGTRAGTPAGEDAATWTPSVRCAAGCLPRVRAFMRVTRRATRSTCVRSVWTGGAVWVTPHGRRHEPATLGSDAGGPGPLTEDRQKPRRPQCGTYGSGRLPHPDGRHGTRNTVPSVAALAR